MNCRPILLGGARARDFAVTNVFVASAEAVNIISAPHRNAIALESSVRNFRAPADRARS